MFTYVQALVAGHYSDCHYSDAPYYGAIGLGLDRGTDIFQQYSPRCRPIASKCFTDTSAPGHFSPKTLRHLYLVPKCPGHFGTGAEVSEDTSAPVPKCLKTLWEGAAGQQQANRTRTCPCGSTCPGSCFATLRQLRSIRRSTSQAVLVVSLVLSRLDYGYATLAGIPGNQIDRLQSVMNAAARLVCSARKYEHITPLLRDLHWLRVLVQIIGGAT